MERSEKHTLVSSMHETLSEAGLVVITSQSGLTVSEVSDLRAKMRESGASYKVMKNTLAKIALKDTQFESVSDLLNGPTALAFSQDPIAAAKVAVEFADKNDKIQVLGGCLDGKYLDVNGVNALAKLPSLDELRGKLIGVISAPATKLAQVLQAPAGQLARVCSAYGKTQ